MEIIPPKRFISPGRKNKRERYQLALYHHTDLVAVCRATPNEGQFPFPWFFRVHIPLELQDSGELQDYLRYFLFIQYRKKDRADIPVPHKRDWTDWDIEVMFELPSEKAARYIWEVQPYSAGFRGRGVLTKIIDVRTGETWECSNQTRAARFIWDYLLTDDEKINDSYEKIENLCKRAVQTGHTVRKKFKLVPMSDCITQVPPFLPERTNSAQLKAAESAMRYYNIIPEAEDAEEEVDELADIF